MKRKIYILTGILCILFFPLVVKAQTTINTNVIINPAECATGIQHVLIKVTIANPTFPDSLYSIAISYGDNGNILHVIGLNSGYQINVLHTYAVPGSQLIKTFLIDHSGNAFAMVDSNQVSTDSICQNSIYGSLRSNNSNSCTTGTMIMAPATLRIDRNGSPIDTVSGLGIYSYLFTPPYPDSIYTVTPINLPLGYSVTCPGTGSYQFSPDTINHSDLSFGLNCSLTSGFDMYCYAAGIYRMQGFSYLNFALGNMACANQSGTVTLNLDPAYIFAFAGITPSSVNGQVITWNFTDLNAMNSPNFYVSLSSINPIPGNIACSYLSITPLTGDNNPANNNFTFCDTIRASYDPNDKKVYPAGDIAPGTLLTYTINFENLGNDTAFNVAVLDTLSENLDLSTLKLLASSHPVQLNLKSYNNSKIARFNFPDIHLGDKNHPATNKGFVMYQAKAKTGLLPGTEIGNTAHIYFDINPAVVTNTVISKIPVLTSVNDLSQTDDLSLFPNPATEALFINNKNGKYTQAVLTNTLGQVVAQSNLTKGINRMTTASLTPGIYYLLVKGAQGSRSLKVTRQ